MTQFNQRQLPSINLSGSGVIGFVPIEKIVTLTNASSGTFLRGDGSWQTIVGGSGVSSVGLTVPTGFSVGGSPVTSAGDLALSFTAGYSLPTNISQSNWDTAYSWGNHALAGYAASGHTHTGVYQPANATLDAVASGTYTGDDSITTVGTLSTGTIPWSLLSSVPSTFTPSAHTLDSHSNVNITSNTAGEVLKWDGGSWVNNTLAEAGISATGHVHAWSDITTGKPTTLSGYGITDAQPLDTDLTNIAALTGTSGFLKTNGANTWTVDTNTYLTTNQSITVSGEGSGSGTTSLTLNNASVIGKVLTGYTSGAGTVSATDTILQAIQKLNGNDSLAVVANGAITGATKTKLTYDAKGLITSGADATTADIADSSNKRYVTDAQLTVVGNTSGTNTGDETRLSLINKIGLATTSVTGVLSATDWTTFNNKESSITAGATGQFWRGDKTWATIPWNVLSNPTANETLTMSTFRTTWNYSGTMSGNAFSLIGASNTFGSSYAMFAIENGTDSSIDLAKFSSDGVTKFLVNFAGNVYISSLTSGRVPYIGTSGLLQDSANFTFDGTKISLPTTGNTGGLSIGGDTNLYRSAADILKTDDAFVANSFNKVNITAPATSATLTIADGQTLTVNGSATITNGTHSGTNTGDQTITLTGDTTGSGTGSFATTTSKLNGTSLAGLGTGLLKNTTGTGVPSIAVNSDLPTMSATVGGAVPTPPNNTTTFLRGDATFATPTTTNITEGTNLYWTTDRGLATTLTGFTNSGTGVISSSDTILSSIQKLDSADRGIPTYRLIVDDFVAGSTSTQQIGELKWYIPNGTITRPTPVSGHPGAFTATSATTQYSSAIVCLHGPGNVTGVNYSDIERMTWVIKTGSDMTNGVWLFGCYGNSIYDSYFGNEALTFEHLSFGGTATWKGTCRHGGSTSTVNTVGATVLANTWYQLDILRVASNNWSFFVNGVNIGTITNNQPSGTAGFGANVQTYANPGAREYTLDYFSVVLKTGNRY